MRAREIFDGAYDILSSVLPIRVYGVICFGVVWLGVIGEEMGGGIPGLWLKKAYFYYPCLTGKTR